ncbi:uncharacterized protein LOC129969438 [Argiope bruennichi]|uniref:uncharacterized protein LOC129969438 n=1 Tax=Argiope bruennichi TaxID=94029 RepID=UPI002495130C|nr:uncharacterized protein LOC129969438 [Argiope bruennichi]XP_055939983.1 uncharacterized protein LOC129969438 [Argiope bruennichi]
MSASVTGCTVINPKPFLQSLMLKNVRVTTKCHQEYVGRLISSDSYMNVELHNVIGYQQGRKFCDMIEAAVRCNNIVYIHEIDREVYEQEMRQREAELIKACEEEK